MMALSHKPILGDAFALNLMFFSHDTALPFVVGGTVSLLKDALILTYGTCE